MTAAAGVARGGAVDENRAAGAGQPLTSARLAAGSPVGRVPAVGR
ncbi:hypothetical protein ACFY12_06270 [Streptomyces sp. NPDC001339]